MAIATDGEKIADQSIHSRGRSFDDKISFSASGTLRIDKLSVGGSHPQGTALLRRLIASPRTATLTKAAHHAGNNTWGAGATGAAPFGAAAYNGVGENVTIEIDFVKPDTHKRYVAGPGGSTVVEGNRSFFLAPYHEFGHADQAMRGTMRT